ncbi:MAG: pyroglutamyl-peptidase I [Methyloceanibacter sp.]
MARPRVLLTGFGPFPGAAENSSAWLVEELAADRQSSHLGCDLHDEVLPTEWAEVARLGPGLVQHHRPRLTLHLGLHKRAQGFRIERSAHNLIDLREDARGAVLDRRTILDRSDRRLDTAIPASQLARHLRTRGLPAVASPSAGTYLCNYLYYLSLHWARGQNGACDVCFVHLPPGPSQGGPLSEAEMLRGAELIMRYLLAFALDRDGAETSGGEIGPGMRVAEPMPR